MWKAVEQMPTVFGGWSNFFFRCTCVQACMCGVDVVSDLFLFYIPPHNTLHTHTISGCVNIYSVICECVCVRAVMTALMTRATVSAMPINANDSYDVYVYIWYKGKSPSYKTLLTLRVSPANWAIQHGCVLPCIKQPASKHANTHNRLCFFSFDFSAFSFQNNTSQHKELGHTDKVWHFDLIQFTFSFVYLFSVVKWPKPFTSLYLYPYHFT